MSFFRSYLNGRKQLKKGTKLHLCRQIEMISENCLRTADDIFDSKHAKIFNILFNTLLIHCIDNSMAWSYQTEDTITDELLELMKHV